jgi:hypothetical protein
MQDRAYDEPMHREEEERPHQDVFGIDCGLWGSAPGRWTWTMMDRTPPVMIGRFPGHVAALIRLVWHVWHDAGAPGGATFHSFGVYHALRGPTSPFRGLTP